MDLTVCVARTFQRKITRQYKNLIEKSDLPKTCNAFLGVSGVPTEEDRVLLDTWTRRGGKILDVGRGNYRWGLKANLLFKWMPRCRFFSFVDDDAYIEGSEILRAYEEIRTRKKCAQIGAMGYFERLRHLGNGGTVEDAYVSWDRVGYCVGAGFQVFRWKAVQDVGGFDSRLWVSVIFDLSLRLKSGGWSQALGNYDIKHPHSCYTTKEVVDEPTIRKRLELSESIMLEKHPQHEKTIRRKHAKILDFWKKCYVNSRA